MNEESLAKALFGVHPTIDEMIEGVKKLPWSYLQTLEKDGKM